jgi:hypothetical protein
LIHAGQDVVRCAPGIHITRLRYEVVLHLVKADVENNECQPVMDISTQKHMDVVILTTLDTHLTHE